jgi:hypothetical protein
MMRAAIFAGILACVAAAPASADDKDKLVGSWKLVAFFVQASDTKESRDALGPNPVGRLIMAPNGAITNFRVAADRKPAKDDAERAALIRTMAAWTGRYRVEGDRVVIDVERSWNEAVNYETVRTFKLEGNRLTWTNVTSSSNFFPGRPAVGSEVFERED